MTSLRFGILSTARVAARRVVPAIHKAHNARALAMASRDALKAQTFAAQHQIAKAYGSYETLLADDEIDAVYIPLPNALHREWTVKAAQAGKHVLCEKPFAANAREADDMIAACEANGVLLMEAFMYRFHPQTMKVKELVDGGQLGALRLVRAVFGFTIVPEGNFRLNELLAGGCLLDVGTYCVNVARTLIGAEPREVVALAQFGAHSRVDEMMAGVLQFSQGVMSSFECSFTMPYRAHYEVIGERGRIEVPMPFITNNRETHIVVHDPDDRIETFKFPVVDPYQLMIEHFAACALHGLPLRYPPSDARAQMRVLDALHESARTGKAVRILDF